jgi:hypothetical protein
MKSYILDTNVLELRFITENIEKINFLNIKVPDVIIWELEERGHEIVPMIPKLSIINTTLEHINIYKSEIENQFIFNNESIINLFKGKGTADPLILTHLLFLRRELLSTLNLDNVKFSLVTNDRGLTNAAKKLNFEVVDSTEFIDILKAQS